MSHQPKTNIVGFNQAVSNSPVLINFANKLTFHAEIDLEEEPLKLVQAEKRVAIVK